MLPIAIPAIASLADTAITAWSRMAESQAASKAQSSVDFVAMLEKAAAHGGSTQGIQQQIAALPEVKALLASSAPGSPIGLSISADGGLSKLQPGGGKVEIPLSLESQAVVRQWSMANPGSSLSLALVA